VTEVCYLVTSELKKSVQQLSLSGRTSKELRQSRQAGRSHLREA